MRLIAALAIALSLSAAPLPKISEKTAGMERLPGFFTVHYDASQAKLWLEVGRWNDEFIYVSSLPAGLGSNDIGLDRGQLGETRMVRFERHGQKILLIESNTGYRASSTDAAERRAVRDSFAESVLWGFDAAAEEDGRVLVDATAFYLRDAHQVGRTLERARQGSWRADASRSAIYRPMTRSFPRNTEVEAIVTLTGSGGGGWLRSVVPSNESVTVRQRHSFVAPPEPGYAPRAYDPRAGYFPTAWMDYSTPITEPIVKRVIRRHRLTKDASGATVKPIVYYVDRGTPEPIRTALVEGARWWNQAFEAAGFRDAFRVEVMPEGADPMDVRYNVIQWVHRSTRGWSYGSSVADPRTGEIIKGHVSLGSLRVRQDLLIAQAFLSPFGAAASTTAEMERMSLARLRQLSAHEVGHTLGLSHNYIASTQSNSSVMDYPHPYIELDAGGVPSMAKAYPEGIGEWDKVSIDYGYRQFPSGTDERKSLDQILQEAIKRGLYFLTDQDARPPGSAHPEVHLWDNGPDAASELTRMMKVRTAALARFGSDTIRDGDSWATLEDLLVPLYFSHRYQVEAAAKVVGGVRYRYAMKGDGQPVTEVVPSEQQKRALVALLAAIEPQALAVPPRILGLIPPRPSGMSRTEELFRGRTNPVLDPVAAAETASDLIIALLLDPQRATRLAQQGQLATGQLTLDGVLRALFDSTWAKPAEAGLAGEMRGAASVAYLRRLLALAASPDASPAARGSALARIQSLKSSLGTISSPHARFALSQIAAFEKEPKSFALPPAPAAPPGMPIGMDHACLWE